MYFIYINNLLLLFLINRLASLLRGIKPHHQPLPFRAFVLYNAVMRDIIRFVPEILVEIDRESLAQIEELIVFQQHTVRSALLTLGIAYGYYDHWRKMSVTDERAGLLIQFLEGCEERRNARLRERVSTSRDMKATMMVHEYYERMALVEKEVRDSEGANELRIADDW